MLIVALVVIGVLALVFLFTASARRDRGAATGVLNRETRKRDRSGAAVEKLVDEPVSTGKEVERAAVVERRRSMELDVPPPPAPPAPLDADALGVTRRQFINRGLVGAFGLGLAGFGAACLGFIWPVLSGGFGSKLKAGSLSDILAEIADTKEPVYVPEGRLYLVPFPKGDVDKARKAYSGGVLTGMEAGVVALYQKCVHLGCRVPWCTSSQWFECPCHGSKYNRVGEKKAGPAPRGLDRFPVAVQGGQVVVDTGLLVVGPPIGVNTTGQEAEGPFCA